MPATWTTDRTRAGGGLSPVEDREHDRAARDDQGGESGDHERRSKPAPRGDARPERAFQIGLDGPHRLVPVRGVLLEALHDDRVDAGPRERGVDLARRLRLLRHVLVEDRDLVPLKRGAARRHDVEDATERIDVGATIGRLVVGLLRADRQHAAFRAARLPCETDRGAPIVRRCADGHRGDAEVGDLRDPPRAEDVGGLEIAVDHRLLALVRVHEPVEDAAGQAPEALALERALGLDDLGERRSAHVLHRDVRAARLGAGVVDRHHVLGPEVARRPRLAEDGATRLLFRDARRDLDRDLALQDRIPRDVDERPFRRDRSARGPRSGRSCPPA